MPKQCNPIATGTTTAYIKPQCAAATASLHRHLHCCRHGVAAAPPSCQPPAASTTTVGGCGGRLHAAAPTPRGTLPLLGNGHDVSWNGIVCSSAPEMQH